MTLEGLTLADSVRQRVRGGPSVWVIVGAIGALALAIVLPRHLGGADPIDAAFPRLPAGWTIVSTHEPTAEQTAAIGQRLGTELQRVTNTLFEVEGQRLQINTLTCRHRADLPAVVATLRAGKSNPHLVTRRGDTAYEFVARTPEDMQLAARARHALGIQPTTVRYRVRFDAAPISAGDNMAFNPLFNLFLAAEQGRATPDSAARIAELAGRFTFDDTLRLRLFGQGDQRTQWSFDPNAIPARSRPGLHAVRFDELPRRFDVPIVAVTAEVVSTHQALTPALPEEVAAARGATPHWPADDPALRALAADITAGADTPAAKVQALLAWSVPGRNIRFDGPITGSRYGVGQVLAQRFGHCWDFSDVFVTLCRASGVPARQVLGWVHEGEGHVWAEVFEGTGWRQVDPTAGMGCGSEYVPYITSIDGRMPLLYASSVRIDVVEATE